MIGACALLLGLALALGSEARAAVTHRFASSLSEAAPGTKLEEPTSVAIDHKTGQVFVGDEGTETVDVYSSSGVFETSFGEEIEPASLAIDEATGDVYVAEPFSALVLAYRPDGKGSFQLLAEWGGAATPGKAFGEVTGVAFDNAKEGGSDPKAGDLYVVESEAVSEGTGTGSGAVDLFKPKPNPAGSEEGEGEEGSFVERIGGPKLEEPNAIAVDSATGQVLVAASANGFIATYSDKGVFEEKLTGKGQPFGSFKGKEEEEENIAAIAVEETSGDIYVAEAEHHALSQYSPAGDWLGWTVTGAGGAALGEPRGVALSGSGELYGAEPEAGLVDRFGAGVVVPDVVTAKASKATRTSAILSGTIDGDGKAAKYSFQWGTTEALGQSTTAKSSGAGEEKVSSTVEGLHAGTIYFFRIVGENENGSSFGLIHEFETPPAVEGLSTGPASELKPTSLTLTGSFTPGGFDTHYLFQWGTSTAYGNSTPLTDAGSGAGSFEAKAPLTGLSPNTTYHYRIVAENEFGQTAGSDRSAITSGPPRITNEAPTEITHEAAKLHAKVDPGELATRYRFEYGTTTAYGTEVPLGGASIGEGSAFVPVEAALSGLKIGTTYHYRVVAENSDETTVGPDESFETIPPAPIDATFVSGVNSTEATLGAQINPLGSETTYFFQYGTQSCMADPGACTDIPATPATVGSGTGDVAETQLLTGLEPATTYHYRALAHNALGTTEGKERTFTTQAGEAAFTLADDRSWEMVSPPEKHGAPVLPLTREGGWVLGSEDGNSLTYLAGSSIVAEPEGNRSPEVQQVLATRTASGWSSQDLETPQTKAQGTGPGRPPEYQFFSPDLSTALVEPPGVGAEPPLAPGVNQKTMYLRDNASGSYLPLVTEANVPAGTTFQDQLKFLAATPDLSHVVLESKVALTPGPSGQGLYEWSEGKLQFLSLLPGGTTPAPRAELGYFHVAAHALSSDGSRVIWTNWEEAARHVGHVYMTDTLTGQTLQLDAAQGLPEPQSASAEFQSASSDGSRVFFTDKQRLTPDSTAEPTLNKPDLYECEVVQEGGKLACHLKDLTVDHNEGEHAAVQGFLLGIAEDGSAADFVAQGVLASNQNGNGERAQANGFNLYEVRNSGGEWQTTFIAGLSKEDKPEWEGEISADTAYLTARVSPNGRYLAFMSAASPTGYDNVDQSSGKPDEEVYLYDAQSRSLSCASCNPSGARPAGVLDTQEAGEGLGLLVDQRKVWIGRWIAGNVPGWTAQAPESALYQTRYLLNDGRLFFNSPDHLVPQATSGKESVYEYEPAGLGSCESASGACVSLLSGGSSDRESAFLEATPDGEDVFFLTAAQLLPQDTDGAFDIYDARVCTEASPCLTAPVGEAPSCSETSSCRPAQPPQPLPGGPAGTSTFSGPASVVSAPPKPLAKTPAKAKPLTRAQKLAKALGSCRRQFAHAKKKRKACEAHATKLYGPKKPKAKRSRAKKPPARRSQAHGSRAAERSTEHASGRTGR